MSTEYNSRSNWQQDVEPLISLIITTYSLERLADFSNLLESIVRQDYTNIEVIFVGERDPELREVVERMFKDSGIQKFKVLFNYGNRGLSAARNVGISASTGSILAFVDDDVILPHEWASNIAKSFQRFKNAIGITGPIIPKWDDAGMDWFPREFEWLISCSGWIFSTAVIPVRNVWGANFSFRRTVFDRVGRFNEEYGFPKGSYEGSLGEDNEFSLRACAKLEGSILYVPETLLYHQIHKKKLRWQFMIRRSFWMGYSRRLLENRFPSKDSNVLNQEKRLLMALTSMFPRLLTRSSHITLRRVAKVVVLAVVSLSCAGLGYVWGVFGGSSD